MALFRAKYYKKRIKYYGTATPLRARAYNLAAVTIGDYALFGGGYYNNDYKRQVYAYNTSLTQSIPDGLTVNTTVQGWSELATATVGNYALFGGGGSASSSMIDVVVSYNTSLTRGFPTVLSQARYRLDGVTVGNYALFGGGGYWSSRLVSSDVTDAYNTSLTRSTPTALSEARYNLSATTVGNYALFGGGTKRIEGSSTIGDMAIVDVYDTSLTRSVITSLSQARTNLAAVTISDYALFGGGSDYTYNNVYNIVDAYDTSLTRSVITPLSQGKYYLAATTVDNYALFGGGYNAQGASNTVDVYDVGLTKTTITPLSYARRSLAATTVGSYALFGGGVGSDSQAGYAVDVYTI